MAGTLTLTCLRPGGGAYVVDGGRAGHRAAGVPSGGPADPRAMMAANRLLGRPLRAICLETTLNGGRWLLSGRGQIVVTGADFNWRLNGRILEGYTVIYVEGDALLTGGPAVAGLRGYLAVNGDWDLPLRLGGAEIGLPGIDGITPGWSVDVHWRREAAYQGDLDVHRHRPTCPFTLPVTPGPEWSWLTEDRQTDLLHRTYLVGADSSRQGIRLQTTSPCTDLPQLISSPVLPGTVQLTPAGPVLLGPDAQTIGGYPRVLLVAEMRDWGAAFQVELGGEVRLALQNG